MLPVVAESRFSKLEKARLIKEYLTLAPDRHDSLLSRISYRKAHFSRDGRPYGYEYQHTFAEVRTRSEVPNSSRLYKAIIQFGIKFVSWFTGKVHTTGVITKSVN